MWSAPIGVPSATLNFTRNEACVQFDAQFILFERGSSAAAAQGQIQDTPGHVAQQDERKPALAASKNHVLWASDRSSYPTGPYFLGVSDDCSLCTWAGAPNGPGQPHPPLEKAVWCGSRGPCPSTGTNADATRGGSGVVAAAATAVGTTAAADRRRLARGAASANAGSGGFPATCSLASWRSRGMDRRSVVADPMIEGGGASGDGGGGEWWRLRAGSPALQLGFRQLNVSQAGPRPL